MRKSEAISMHCRPENIEKFPVFVLEENGMLVTEIDGIVCRASTVFKLDYELDKVMCPSPRNMYFVDEPDYENIIEE